MAEVSMKDFLTQYYMQRVFNAMSDEQFAQYQSIIKTSDFIGNMKDWKEKWNLVVENPIGSGKWEKNDAPDPATFNLAPGSADYDSVKAEKEWENLYKELRKAFRAVASDRSRLDDNDDKKTLTFLDTFYGFGQLFEPAKLMGNAADQLNNVFLPFVENNETNLYQALKDLGIYTDTQGKFSDFIKDLKTGKHNTDNDVRSMLAHIISYLQSSYYGPAITERMGGATIPDLSILATGLENDDIDPTKLQYFKDNYRLILNPILSEKNIYQHFSPNLKNVNEAIEKAKKRVDYNNADSKDFLQEKRIDEKGAIEKTVDNVKQWWGDHTDKYFSLHKSRLFYSDEAKAISKAIDATKFKPTEGLDKFVSSLKDIGDKVKGNKAKQHFKWFADTMTKLHGDKQMKSIFAGALKNPRKLKELAAEIAIQGIKDGKKDEEIQTAMEVLKTIQYGYATSNHLDAVMAQDLTLFSDKSLSWNKHEGMNFVMTGVDKTINATIKGTTLVFSMGYNILNRNIGNKFKGNVSKRAQASFKSQQDKIAAQVAEKQAQKDLLDRMDNDNLTAAYNDLADVNRDRRKRRIDDTTLVAEEARLATLRQTANNKKTRLSTAQQGFNAADTLFQNINSTINDQKGRGKNLKALNDKIKDLKTQIDAIDAKGNSAKPSEIAALNNLVKEQQELTAQRDQLVTEIRNANTNYKNALSNRTSAESSRNNAEAVLQDAQKKYDKASNAANDLSSRIEKFKSATQRIQETEERLNKREEEFDKWQNEDKKRFAHLMAHWDFLNSGRMRTGENVFMQALEGILPLSQESRQKRYNARKNTVHNAFLAKYQSKYGLAA